MLEDGKGGLCEKSEHAANVAENKSEPLFYVDSKGNQLICLDKNKKLNPNSAGPMSHRIS
jgi:hypothetical protein